MYICTALSQELVNNASRGSEVPLLTLFGLTLLNVSGHSGVTRSISRAGDRQHVGNERKMSTCLLCDWHSADQEDTTRDGPMPGDQRSLPKWTWAQWPWRCTSNHPRPLAWPCKELTSRRAEWGSLRRERKPQEHRDGCLRSQTKVVLSFQSKLSLVPGSFTGTHPQDNSYLGNLVLVM